jgi:hypothetical protein
MSEINPYRVLVRKFLGKWSVGRSRRSWEYYLREISCEDERWMALTQDRVQ